MIHPITAAKNTAVKYRTPLIYGTGVVSGIAVTLAFGHYLNVKVPREIPMNLTGDDLIDLIKQSGGKGFIATSPRSGAKVIVSTLDAYK